MAKQRFKPDHPLADDSGWVELNDDYYVYLPQTDPDNVATIDGQRICMNYISDHMDETRHMANGKYYTSKSSFRKATKAAGCIEVGNDPSIIPKARKPIVMDRRKRREDIRSALHEIKGKTKTKKRSKQI